MIESCLNIFWIPFPGIVRETCLLCCLLDIASRFATMYREYLSANKSLKSRKSAKSALFSHLSYLSAKDAFPLIRCRKSLPVCLTRHRHGFFADGVHFNRGRGRRKIMDENP